MRLFVLLAALTLVAAAMTTGCGRGGGPTGVAGTGNNSTGNAGPRNPNTPPDNVRRVTISELRDALEQGKAVVVDVRGDDAYKQEHIKGALNITETQVSARGRVAEG
jgi:hypothetical protein